MNDLTDRIREGDLNQITIVVYGDTGHHDETAKIDYLHADTQ